MPWFAAGLCVAAAFGHPCEPCHSRQVAGFLQTGMGRSMRAGVPAASSWNGTVGATRYRVDGGTQAIERGGIRSTHTAEYSIGSGNHAVGFLVRTGDYVFQSPLSWYTRRRRWDAAPGYQNNTHPDFNRPVIAECLFCHANRAAPAKETLNRYPDSSSIGEAISCERCHGGTREHLLRPGRGNIVNPARLEAERRDAICEQCHLGGEARILNPGRSWADFQPGARLENTFSVYVGSPRGRFKVVGHVEQLALSRCAQQSAGRLWCGTCHDPHGPPAKPVDHYRAKCLGCHEEAKHPKTAATRDCAGCHMPRRQAPDSGHAAFTDHWIRRLPATGDAQSRPSQLAAWRPPPADFEQRNLGLAYVSVGEKEQATELLGEGGRILSGSKAEDPEALAALGLVRLLQDRPRDAVLFFERAVAARPAWATYYLKLAIAWNAAGNRERAIRVLKRGIEVDPSIEALYHKLAEFEGSGAGRKTLERYLEFAPKSLIGREALAGHR